MSFDSCAYEETKWTKTPAIRAHLYFLEVGPRLLVASHLKTTILVGDRSLGRLMDRGIDFMEGPRICSICAGSMEFRILNATDVGTLIANASDAVRFTQPRPNSSSYHQPDIIGGCDIILCGFLKGGDR